MNRSILTILAALASGIVFGVGLAISQMTDPQKIKNFLDLAAIPSGGWDPSLIFVMGGGVVVAFVGLRLNRWMARPLVADNFVITNHSKIDRQLITGAIIFGIGWGLSGFCPGPAVANLGVVPAAVLPFVAAMFAGSWITGAVQQRMDLSAHNSAEAAPG